jgi:tetrahydromethanopterin S-methyltransferase subunit B
MRKYIFLILIVALVSFVSAAENGVGMGDAVYNSILRANSTLNVTGNLTIYEITIMNVTPQLDVLEGKVDEIKTTLDTYTNLNQTCIQKETPLVGIYLLLFGIIVGIIVLGVMVKQRKDTKLYRCSHCQRLFLKKRGENGLE